MGLPAKQLCQFGQFGPILREVGWIGSAVYLVAPERLPGFSFFSIVLGAKYFSYVKSIATFALPLFGYIISVLGSVNNLKSYYIHFQQSMERFQLFI